jgi:type IV pilus assembly protein PilA
MKTKALNARGFTLVELIVVVAVIGILAGMSVTQILRARMVGNEAAAIGSLRAVNTAQQSYAQQCRGYAPDLPELKNAGNFLSPDLTGAVTVSKSGFSVTVAQASTGTPLPAPPPGCVGTTTNYYATATPISVGSSGQRAFATDAQGTIYFDTTGVPPADPIPVGATPIE